jgi:tetratricopeptide (TPR) repeat protein
MPIDDRKSRGGVDTSLRWFTDRAQLIRRFLEYIYGPKPVQQVLYFWGDGGNGKSKLLEMLHKHFCKYLPEVEQERVSIEHETYERLRQIFEGGVADRKRQVVTSFLDFDAPPQGEDNPKEAFSALFMLKRALGSQEVKFPRFDYAGVLYLLKNNRFTPDRVKQLFPNEEFELATALANLFGDLPVVKQVTDAIDVVKKVMGVAGKRTNMEEKVTLYLQSRGVDRETAEWIKGLDPEFGKELYNELPVLFAADLNEAIEREGGPARIVLFFDTLEALNRQDRNAAGYGFFRTDEWLRRLVRGLAMEKGIVVVVAGRDPLRWREAPEFEIGAEYLDVRKVDLFSEADAEDYLTKRKVADAELRKAIIAYASATRGEVHPLLLGMAADVLELAEERGEVLKAQDFSDAPALDSKERLLINRMLKYMEDTEEYAIRALSVCRVFDYEIYERLGEKLHFQTEMPRFKRLTEYSFVTRIQQGDGREAYRIHGLLRRLFYEQGDELIRAADGVMEEYYQGLSEAGDRLAVIEVIYHANRLDWETGAKGWITVFDRALEVSQYELCEALTDVRSELTIKGDLILGSILESEANYLTVRSRHDVAEESCTQAIQAFDRALSLAPNDLATLNNKGNVLLRLGELQASLSKAEEAEHSYIQAIQSFDRALFLAPDHPQVLNNKGLVLQRLGELQASLSKAEEAEHSYIQAIQSYDMALSLAPDHPQVLNNKGNVLLRFGELQASLSKAEEAEHSYIQAIQSFDKALSLAPDYVVALNNKGLVLQSLGELQASLSKAEEAEHSYAQAIQASDRALSLAPNDLTTLNNKGNVLLRLGELQASLSKAEEAEHSYIQAIQSFDKALSLAPDHVFALNNKGLVLQRLGELQASLSKAEEAEHSYIQAIQSYDMALSLAPDYVVALNNKGLVLQSLGKLQASLSKAEEAEHSYIQAIQSFDKALSLATDYVAALNNKGNVLQRLGKLQASLSKAEEAEHSYIQAIQSYDMALSLATDYVVALNNKGGALRSLGELQASLSKAEEAEHSYIQAIQSFDKALFLAPDYPQILNNKGIVLISMGDLLVELKRVPEACANFDKAWEAYKRSLKIAPNDKRVQAVMMQLEGRIQEVCKSVGEGGE